MTDEEKQKLRDNEATVKYDVIKDHGGFKVGMTRTIRPHKVMNLVAKGYLATTKSKGG